MSDEIDAARREIFDLKEQAFHTDGRRFLDMWKSASLERDKLLALLVKAGEATVGMAKMLEHLRRAHRIAPDDYSAVEGWRDKTNALIAEIRRATQEAGHD